MGGEHPHLNFIPGAFSRPKVLQQASSAGNIGGEEKILLTTRTVKVVNLLPLIRISRLTANHDHLSVSLSRTAMSVRVHVNYQFLELSKQFGHDS